MAIRSLLQFVRRRLLPLLPSCLVFGAVAGLSISLTLSHDPSGQMGVARQAPAAPAVTTERAEVLQTAVNLAHEACFKDEPFPPASKCQPCHDEIYREWSVSQHAYTELSPVFNAFSNKLLKLTSGTNGDFCIRCHTPTGMAQHEALTMSTMDRHKSSREGITCVVCHRINQPWGKISGRQALVAGDLNQVVYGPYDRNVLAEVFANPDRWGATKTEEEPDRRARSIHKDVVPFFQIITPNFCGSCHDVFGPDGFRLEDALSEFRMAPAARCKKENCQDCHMSVTQGIPSGFSEGPAARMGNLYTPPRQHHNHMIVGPDYSIVHPGLFPHHPYAIREEGEPADQPYAGLATMREWLTFDVAAGWGRWDFEKQVPADYKFPEPWKSREKRVEARKIVDYNINLLNEATAMRHELLAYGYQIGEVVTERADHHGIKFKIKVWNDTDGHGVPTGFDEERLVWLQVTVSDSTGKVVFKSGDLDPNGDVRNEDSFYVANGELPFDLYLFTLQSRLITTNLRGGERTQILNVPYTVDPLPFVRPEIVPYGVIGRPLLDRKQKKNIEVGGHRWANYEVKGCDLTGHGPYEVTVDLKAGMVPANLVQEISDVGFDYSLSARTIADRIVAGHVLVHERKAVINLP